ncbi:hypothetical protein QTP86_011515 [Hemibagrus guttatus]|nr:hypothetical protein QTP86_011515 [Hemibagrus guttatus]
MGGKSSSAAAFLPPPPLLLLLACMFASPVSAVSSHVSSVIANKTITIRYTSQERLQKPFRGGLARVFWIIVLLQNPSSLQLEDTNLLIYQSGKGYKAISKALGLPRTTVRAIIYKWRKHGTVENLPRSGRPTKITPRAQRQLIQEVTKDPTTTSKELQASLASVKKKDVRMMRFIQEVNTTTRSCALWDLEADTEYIVHVQSISMSGTSPPSDPVLFRTPKESEKMASKSPDDVTMKEVGQAQLRAGELIIIVVVLIMWAVVISVVILFYS